jgi:hypothetical protein
MNDNLKSISDLQKYLASGCRIESVQPPVFASDAEINIVTVSIVFPDGNKHTIRAYRDEARALREFILLKKDYDQLESTRYR